MLMQAGRGRECPKNTVPNVPGSSFQQEDGGGISGVVSAQKQSKTV